MHIVVNIRKQCMDTWLQEYSEEKKQMSNGIQSLPNLGQMHQEKTRTKEEPLIRPPNTYYP